VINLRQNHAEVVAEGDQVRAVDDAVAVEVERDVVVPPMELLPLFGGEWLGELTSS
jgi:hypothetical protein